MSIIDKKSQSFQKITNWRNIVASYQNSHRWRSNWQLINTLVPYIGLWFLMYQSLKVSYWLTLPLLILTSGFQIRLFIIFHDCGHRSFYRSNKFNSFWGNVLGVINTTAFKAWTNEHAKHHNTSSNLDKRGTGDVWTMTADEYMNSSRFTRILYRITRSSLFLFIIVPIFLFLIIHRFHTKEHNKAEKMSIHLTSIGLLLLIATLIYFMGLKSFLLIYLPLSFIVSTAGVWLFYVQHQFKGVYWARGHEWDYETAAMNGSSYYKLPKVLQWFTGNIGFHHIHHLSSRIPNYFLSKCHKENSLFQKIYPMGFLSSLKSMTYRLWDEENKDIISFKILKERLATGKITCTST